MPHVAVFDTSFHQTLPEAAYSYAISPEVAERHGVRRYGFHGISHQVVSQRAATLLGRPLAELKQIVLHLGNGASACAVDGGRSVDTSMGPVSYTHLDVYKRQAARIARRRERRARRPSPPEACDEES